MSLSPAWSTFLHHALPALRQGKSVDVSTLPHPRAEGWLVPKTAMRVGQLHDWVQALPDGSRLHVHEFSSGRRLVHRDRWNPARSPVHALVHVATETAVGRTATGLAALGTIARLLLR